MSFAFAPANRARTHCDHQKDTTEQRCRTATIATPAVFCSVVCLSTPVRAISASRIFVPQPTRDGIDLDAFGTEPRRFSSAHPSSFEMACCDGPVHSIAYDIDAATQRELANRFEGGAVTAKADREQFQKRIANRPCNSPRATRIELAYYKHRW